MKKIVLIGILLINSIVIFSQNFEDMTFGTDSTFEVVTWNIETFPKNGYSTLNFVSEIIDSLDVDLFAIQEVNDTVLF
jgi:endonuclease/exonuclease/phosphatase family metal-dependent hydrolase